MSKPEKGHIAWIDLLRVIACFLVVLAHCCDPFVAKFDDNYGEFLSGALWGSFVRPCVPLFVMMTGVLLFPIKMEMSAFYKKRIVRIVIPLIFWSIVLPILYFLYFYLGATTVNPAVSVDDHTLGATLAKFITFIFNFNYDTIPLWYLYMLIGLYLVMPIVNAWLLQASQKDVKLILKIWIATMFLPYVQMLAPVLGYTGNYGSMGILGVCDWNAFGTFYYLSGFIGYVILAYYLVKYPLNWSMKKTLSAAIPMFLIGYAITSLGFILTQKYFPASYANLEIIWYFYGINVFLMTLAVFMVVQKINIKNSTFLKKAAPLAFGIYLCHFFLVQVSYDLLYEVLNIPAFLKIPIIACLTFAMSYCLIWIMDKFEITRKVIL
ncbi:acyltransferase family protein [Dysgonomonas sp. OttesenSCG-928-M03]|nr:acyltransferase family protein [Dysgonomonas sp. OttesenSCG-928-M03]